MTGQGKRKPVWAKYSHDELLDLRFTDLKLKLAETPVSRLVNQLYDELHLRQISFKPHCWFSNEWFSPDATPGIAIPFYLAHPKLAKLESKLVYQVEGGTDRSCMQLLRHEAGHAICTAFQLYRRKRFKQIFGRFNKPYPEHYRPDPNSKNYVIHLDWWYAQSHPAEDFAETFSVWLKPRSNWKKVYDGWPAIRKLEYMDELMHSIQNREPVNRNRTYVDPVSTMRTTLRAHYEEKRSHYGVNVPHMYDSELMKLFKGPGDETSGRCSAATFLKKYQTELCEVCARGTGRYPYDIAQIVQEMTVRCRELGLTLPMSEQDTKLDVAIFIVKQSFDYRRRLNYRIVI